eukprot:gene30644-34883_t
MELKECPPGSLAAAAGLCKGMVLRRVNDCPVSTPAQANNASQKFASIVKLLFDPQEAKEQQRGSAHMFLQRPHSATGLPWGMVIDPATMRVRDVVKGSIAAGGDLPLYVSEVLVQELQRDQDIARVHDEQRQAGTEVTLMRHSSGAGLPWGVLIDPGTMKLHDIVPGSIAAQSDDLGGCISQGMVLVRVNGVETRTPQEVAPMLEGCKVRLLFMLKTDDSLPGGKQKSDADDSAADRRILTAQQVIALHEKSGHVGRDRLVGMIRRARGDAAAAAAESILREHSCSVCDRRKPKMHGAATVERERQFNDLLLLLHVAPCDVLMLTENATDVQAKEAKKRLSTDDPLAAEDADEAAASLISITPHPSDALSPALPAVEELKKHHALVEEAKRKEIEQITTQNVWGREEVVAIFSLHVDDLELAAKDMRRELCLLRRQFDVGKEQRLSTAGRSHMHVGMR